MAHLVTPVHPRFPLGQLLATPGALSALDDSSDVYLAYLHRHANGDWGEIRDEETMQIALSASLTGHLVLTTLHTTTAAGTIPRLLDMGAEPFVVASAVTMFVSQRLIRVLCASCKTKIEVPQAVRRRFGLDDVTLYGPRGCSVCRGTGYKGRLGIFELLPMSADIVTAIYERTAPDVIQRDSGRPTLLMDGMRKVRAGVTTLDEILRVTT